MNSPFLEQPVPAKSPDFRWATKGVAMRNAVQFVKRRFFDVVFAFMVLVAVVGLAYQFFR